MVVPPGGMRGRALSDAVIEDKIRHSDPVGTVELTCPACSEPRQMTCYRFSSGLFGRRDALHFVCPTCGGTWTADRSEDGKILESMKAIPGGEPGDPE